MAWCDGPYGLSPPADAGVLPRSLRANSLIQPPGRPAHRRRFREAARERRRGTPPHIFLFCHRQPANGTTYRPTTRRWTFYRPGDRKVSAAENSAFTRAFAPLWRKPGWRMAGDLGRRPMLLHKEYVLPFTPMNSLEKLAEGEPITNGSSGMESHHPHNWSRPRPSLSGARSADATKCSTTFCTTLDELQSKPAKPFGSSRIPDSSRTPRSLNTSRVQAHRHGVAHSIRRSTDSRVRPAEAIHNAWDKCFGGFQSIFLSPPRPPGLYDNSIVNPYLGSRRNSLRRSPGRWGPLLRAVS